MGRPYLEKFADVRWEGMDGDENDVKVSSTSSKNLEGMTTKAKLEAWMLGRTGVPIVDAAMRQATSMGWMHNRARMICASFLTKDLLIDWRVGERVSSFLLSLVLIR